MIKPDLENSLNIEAKELFETNRDEYSLRVKEIVEASMNQEDEGKIKQWGLL